MSQISLKDQLKIATDIAERLEGQNGKNESEYRRKERSAKGKELKLGNSAKFHDDTNWSWETSEADWDGTTD